MTVIRFSIPVRPPRAKRPKPPPRPRNATRRGKRAMRQLALAHRLEQAIENGEVRGMSHAAELFGTSRARMSQIASLVNLSPEIQARILTGDLSIHERALRAALRFVDWNQQRAALTRNDE